MKCLLAKQMLLLAFVVVVFLAPVLFTSRVLLPGDSLQRLQPFATFQGRCFPSFTREPPFWNPLQWDALAQYYPWRLYAKRCLVQNQIPLWNPHEFCGHPFAANGQSAVFYPLNVLFWFLPTAVAFEWSAALHLFLAGAFMFGLARTLKLSSTGSLLSAISFTFCGFIVTWLELPTLVNVAVWIPGVFLLVERILQRPCSRDFVLLVLCIGFQFLAGHLHISLYILVAVVLRILWECMQSLISDRRGANEQRMTPRELSAPASCLASLVRSRSLVVIAAVALGVCLAALQLAPTAELVRYSHRSGNPTLEGYQWYLSNAMPWQHIGTMFAPDLFGNPSKNAYWSLAVLQSGPGAYTEMCGYVGLLPLLLALLSFGYQRRARLGFYGFLMIFSLLVALGTPVTWPLYFLIPGFSQAGGFSRALVLFCFASSLLAGVGWDYGLQRAHGVARRNLIILFVLAALGLLMAHTCFYDMRAFIGTAFEGIPEYPMIPLGFYLCIGWFVFALGYVLGRVRGGAFKTATLLFVAADLVTWGIGFNPKASPHAIYPDLHLRNNGAPRPRSLHISNKWSLSQYQFPDANLPPNALSVYGQYDIQGYDSLQLKQYKSLMTLLENGSPCPRENGNMLLLHNAASPWVSLLGVRYITTTRKLRDTNLRLTQQWPIYTYENPHAFPAAFVTRHLPCVQDVKHGLDYKTASVVSYQPLYVCIHPPEGKGFLTLTDTFFPGWRVFADAEEVPALTWAGMLRAVKLSDLTMRKIEWVYFPNSFKTGGFISLITIAVLTALMCSRMSRLTPTRE